MYRAGQEVLLSSIRRWSVSYTHLDVYKRQTIYFGKPDKKQFQEIVRELAKKNGIDMSDDELFLEANKWELSHGGLSGRTAQQFIDYLAGTR